jgi:Flp pilus assembly protein TadD
MRRLSVAVGLGLLFSPVSARAQDAPASCRDAAAAYAQGRAQDAIAAFRECVAAVPPNPGVLSDYGVALAATGSYDEALVQYRRALELAPGHPAIRRNMALAYYKSGRPADAARVLQELHDADRSNVTLALLLADCHVQLGAPARAVAVLEPFETAHSGEPAFAYVYGLALMNAGEVERAGRVIDPLLRDPSSAQAQMLLGTAAQARGDLPAAAAAFAKAAALAPDLPAVHSLLGQALLGTGDADGAAAAFRHELATNPNDYESNLRLAQILLQRKEHGAEPLLEKARIVRPSASEPVVELARLHAASGDPGRARAELETLIATSPSNAAAHQVLAEVYAALGRSADAARETEEAQRLGIQASDGADGLLGVGTPAPVFELPRAGSPERVSSRALWADRPAVLVFGSLSCPKFRFDASALQAIADEYRDRVPFLMVYIHEAHDEDTWQSTINERQQVTVPPVKSFDDKQHNAALCLRTLALRLPAVVDGLDRHVEQAYAAWPSAVYLVDSHGTVVWRSRLGEQEFSAAAMRAALERALAR